MRVCCARNELDVDRIKQRVAAAMLGLSRVLQAVGAPARGETESLPALLQSAEPSRGQPGYPQSTDMYRNTT